MSDSAIDIERVVREVLAELGAAAGNGAQRPATAPPRLGNAAAPVETPVAEPSARSANELVVDSRVVTMTEIAGRLDLIRRVVVSRKAIVTPAVRDELLRRGVALRCVDVPNGRASSAVRMVLITSGTDFDPAALVAGLTREGFQVEPSDVGCLISATDLLASETAKADALGVLLTRHTAAGLCLANRLGGVRAVTGVDAPAVATAAGAMGANLLVVDPHAGTFFQLKQMVTEFGRNGIRPCPVVFGERLA